jgi:hypothetical protein
VGLGIELGRFECCPPALELEEGTASALRAGERERQGEGSSMLFVGVAVCCVGVRRVQVGLGVPSAALVAAAAEVALGGLDCCGYSVALREGAIGLGEPAKGVIEPHWEALRLTVEEGEGVGAAPEGLDFEECETEAVGGGIGSTVFVGELLPTRALGEAGIGVQEAQEDGQCEAEVGMVGFEVMVGSVQEGVGSGEKGEGVRCVAVGGGLSGNAP